MGSLKILDQHIMLLEFHSADERYSELFSFFSLQVVITIIYNRL